MKRVGLAIALLAGTGLLLTACGSSASSSASSSGSSSTTKAPIKITIIGGFSSSLPVELDPEAAAGARARVAAINAAGGIHGRKVDLVVCNDQVSANTAGDCARSAVADGSVALVGTVGFEQIQTYPIIQAAGMVSIGAFPVAPPIGNSPSAVCFTGGAEAEIAALPRLLRQRGVTQVSALIPGGLGVATTALERVFTAGAKAAGVRIGAISEFPSTSAQFDAPVAKALTPGTNGVIAFAAGPAQGPLVLAIKNAAPNVKIGVAAAAVSPSVIKFLGAHGNGILAAGEGAPPTSNTVGIQMFNHDMNAYESGAAKDDLSINAWASVWLFQRLAESLSSINRGSVLHAAKSLQNYDLGGIYGPLTTSTPFTGFLGDKCVANNTVEAEVLDGGEFHPIGLIPAFKVS